MTHYTRGVRVRDTCSLFCGDIVPREPASVLLNPVQDCEAIHYFFFPILREAERSPASLFSFKM